MCGPGDGIAYCVSVGNVLSCQSPDVVRGPVLGAVCPIVPLVNMAPLCGSQCAWSGTWSAACCNLGGRIVYTVCLLCTGCWLEALKPRVSRWLGSILGFSCRSPGPYLGAIGRGRLPGECWWRARVLCGVFGVFLGAVCVATFSRLDHFPGTVCGAVIDFCLIAAARG